MWRGADVQALFAGGLAAGRVGGGCGGGGGGGGRGGKGRAFRASNRGEVEVAVMSSSGG